ncbi:galactose-3-O-sulfotransferase 4 [Mugil cephalus]|uniref:galactose-3-O-sulfotransferase 4 n=1 Tax=Mugil cephalus TaxID=48193 RepID=UPI001FB70D89|nr:galactose-3-O-sulfotransferase 4 [Mugil cephalus]
MMETPNALYPDHDGRSDSRSSEVQSKKDSHLYKVLKKRKHTPPVVFLKTHKTGSSTVQNLLFRKGEMDRATFAFPHHTFQFSYPDKFREDFVEQLPEGSTHFDILCSHMRLNVEPLKRLMPRNAIYITIIREPVGTFESVFSSYASTVPAFVLAKEAAVNGSALSAFLESPESFWDPTEPGNSLGNNPVSFDLGLDTQLWNFSWQADVTLLKETFQLVMIAEHFDESLVLLADLLNLKLKDLSYVRHNARSTKDVAPLDNTMKAKIRAWNSQDALLYDMFLKLFWEKAGQYGLERLSRNVALLRASTKRIRQKCVARKEAPSEEVDSFTRPWRTDSVTILGYRIQKNLTKQEQRFCMRLVLPEHQYHQHLYLQQYGRAMRTV